jgi:hypothetical protein
MLAQPWPPDRSSTGAKPGDEVRLILNHVRGDQRKQFETFVNEGLLPALRQSAASDPSARHMYERTRFLEPQRANPDGTWTYVWIFDPVVKGEYAYEAILKRGHSPDRVLQFMDLNRQALARPQEVYRVGESMRW